MCHRCRQGNSDGTFIRDGPMTGFPRFLPGQPATRKGSWMMGDVKASPIIQDLRSRPSWPAQVPYLPAFAFAAAFSDCLYERTLPRDSSSTMSATDTNEPSSPKWPTASRQPSGRTPSCLPSSATKIFALTSPNPGSAAIRLSNSAPDDAVVHKAAASPSYSETINPP